MIKPSMVDIAGNLSPALYLSVKSVCIDLSAGIFVAKIRGWEVPRPPRPHAVNRLRVRWLWELNLLNPLPTLMVTLACVTHVDCTPGLSDCWKHRWMQLSDQRTSLPRSCALQLQSSGTSGLSALLEPLWTPQTKSTVTMPNSFRL